MTSRCTGRMGMHVAASALGAMLLIGGLSATAHGDTVTDQNVATAIASAKTPADHQALADYFVSKAEAAQKNVEEHKNMAGGFSGKAQGRMAKHCQTLINTYKQQAKEYTALAKEQAALAK
jgi:hypothetical protein